MTRRFYNRSEVTGEITLPAVPGMIDEYNAPVGPTLNYQVKAQWWTVEGAYENWVETREPPLFGTEPDARVWAPANEAADPTTHRVLEIGAGTGRNALAPARRGHPVDVVELTPKFADMIRSDAERESPISGPRSSCVVCSNSPPTVWLLVHAWCSTSSWRAGATRPTRPRVSSGGSSTRAYSPDTRYQLRQPDYLSSSLPMTPYTTTRKRTCPKAPGRPRAATPIGSVASTCSPSSVRRARSSCAGSCYRRRADAAARQRHTGSSWSITAANCLADRHSCIVITSW